MQSASSAKRDSVYLVIMVGFTVAAWLWSDSPLAIAEGVMFSAAMAVHRWKHRIRRHNQMLAAVALMIAAAFIGGRAMSWSGYHWFTAAVMGLFILSQGARLMRLISQKP